MIILDTFFTTLLVAISLSMDAFSLSLIYGTQNINNKNKFILSIIVGLYHFFMPLLGFNFGSIITKYLIFDINYLVSVIFFIIGIEMIVSNYRRKDETLLLTIPGYLMFGFSVSVDSFITGLGLNVINSNCLEVSIIFCLVSFLFTLLGLEFGIKLKHYFDKISTLIGGIILIGLSIYYFFY